MRKVSVTVTILFLFLYGHKARLVPQVFANSTSPETVHYFDPSSPNGSNGWYTQAVDIQLLATDLESGVASINYKLDDSDWEKKEFLETINLVQNPSFETGNYWWISKWHHPDYPLWKASLRQSFLVHKFGNYSARVFSYSNGWYYWTNEDYYAVTEPYKYYSVRVWVKVLDFWGTGAYFKVWAKNSSGSDFLLAESAQLSGTTDWTALDTSFYMPDGCEGVYLQLGAEGVGFVWWDGADLYEGAEVSYEFAVATEGEHNLSYYSIDRAVPPNVEDTKGPFEFKIDANIPTDWRDFDTSREPGYNDHTFDSTITVSDCTSGIDINTAYYSYSTDEGATWTEWLPIDEYDPSIDGSQNVTLTAKEVDFVDSNWHILKLIQFKVSDMAGLISLSPLITLNAPWLEIAGGAIYAQAGIDLSATPPEPNATGIVISSGSIEGVISSNEWLFRSYPILERQLYEDWLPIFEEPIPLSDVGNKLPTESGMYIVDRNFVINNSKIPDNLEVITNLATTVFVDGTLRINDDLKLHETSGILFIVSGAVEINHTVERIDAAFFVDEYLDSSYSRAPASQLILNGFVVADSFSFRRSLKHTENQDTPAELINFEPKYLLLLNDMFGEEKYSYREVVP